MKIYDTIGFKEKEIEVVKLQLEKAISSDFIEHESSYYGVYYKGSMPGGEELKLYENYYDTDWHNDEFKEYAVLFEVSEVQNLDFFIEQGITPLRRIEITDDRIARSYIFEGKSPVLKAERKL